jgi:hypothetical protein
MTEPDASEPFPEGGDPRGVGESLDAPSADVPAVDDPPAEQAVGGGVPEAGYAVGTPGAGPVPLADPDDAPAAQAATAATAAQAATAATAATAVGALPPQPVVLRRAPRYRSFVLTGAAVGAILGIVLTALFPDRGEFSTAAVTGYVSVSLALVGALIGGGLAVLAERRSGRS